MGLFGCLSKLGAKRADLVQKFVPRRSIGIFRNERTRSTPLDPKLMFWCVSYCLGAFGTIRLPYETRCKTGRTNAKVCATKSHQNFSQRTHSIHSIWVHLRPFGCLTKLGAKRFELVQKFVARRRVGVFLHKHTQSTALDPKHMFWSVSYHLRAFGTIRLPYKTQGKTFRISANFRATRSR